MTEFQREIKRKKRVIEYAEKNGNIKIACRRFGIARSTFYLWRDRYLTEFQLSDVGTLQLQSPICYPYGFHDENTHRAMRELHLRSGLTMERRAIEPQDLSDRWSIPRYDVNDCFDRESNQMQEAIFSQIEASPSETTG